MKLNPVVSVALQNTNATSKHNASSAQRACAKDSFAPAATYVNPRAILKIASVCAIGLQLPRAAAAPLPVPNQQPLLPMDAPFSMGAEEGGWDCTGFVDGKVKMRGTWQQFPKDRWGTDIIQRMWVPGTDSGNEGEPKTEQITSYDITTQPFKITRWPWNNRYEVQDIIVTTHAENDHTFIWDLLGQVQDKKWSEQWVDLVDDKHETMLRQRYSNRTEGGAMTLQDTFTCRHW